MAKTVLTKEEADKIALDYAPKKFPLAISPIAVDFVQYQSKQEQPSFHIDRLVANQTGIDELERLSIEEKVEKEALARLKNLEEEAYHEAYQLGLQEGTEKAFLEQSEIISEKLGHLDRILSKIQNLKVDLVNFNEAHIMRLIFYMAKRLMLDEVAANPESVLTVVQQAIANAQSEEDVVIRVSPMDFSFIETIKEKMGKEYDAIRKAKIESSDDITNGGCVIATNFGDVDAQVEKRLEQLWEAISEKVPKLKPVVGG